MRLKTLEQLRAGLPDSVRKLYQLSKGEGRVNAATLQQGALEVGVKAELVRASGGYSSKGPNAGNKLPDRVWLELDGHKYGNGIKTAYGTPSTLVDFAQVVVDKVDDTTRHRMEVDYHIAQLESLGVHIETFRVKQ